MKKLLRFEMRNMLRQKIIYAAASAMLVLLTLENYTSPARMQYYQQIGYGVGDMVVGIVSSCFFTYFLAVIIAPVVCRDYEQNVLKNVCAKGYAQSTVYSGKFLFSMILATALFALTVLVGFTEALIVFRQKPSGLLTVMLAQYLAVLAYTAFYFLFCQIFRKSGYAIAFLVLIPPLGGLLLDNLDSSLRIPFSFGSLWITQTMAYIHGGNITGRDILGSVAASLSYIVICYFAGRLVLKRQN